MWTAIFNLTTDWKSIVVCCARAKRIPAHTHTHTLQLAFCEKLATCFLNFLLFGVKAFAKRQIPFALKMTLSSSRLRMKVYQETHTHVKRDQLLVLDMTCRYFDWQVLWLCARGRLFHERNSEPTRIYYEEFIDLGQIFSLWSKIMYCWHCVTNQYHFELSMFY